MSEKCICCGKKIGALSNSFINGKVCESCYIKIGKNIRLLNESKTLKEAESERNSLITIIKSSPYSEDGKQYIIEYANNILNLKIKENDDYLTKQNFKMTTSNSFDGYKIKNYIGIFSGSTALGTGIFSEFNANFSDLLGVESYAFSDKLETAKDSAIIKLVDNAIKHGANALIGVGFDYVNFTSNMIGVVANGTAVEIVEQEKTQVE